MVLSLVMCRIFADEVKPSVTPPALDALITGINAALDQYDVNLARASRDLAGVPLQSPRAREIILKLCRENTAVVDCAIVDLNGVMIVIEPQAYKASEGVNIGGQVHVKKLHESRQPVFSETFRSAEGYDAASFAWPIISPENELLVSDSLLVRLDLMISHIADETLKGLPLDSWAIQKNGRLVYDPDEQEIGRNVITDPLYESFPSLVELTKKIITEEEGTGYYEFYSTGITLAKKVRKSASWKTVVRNGLEIRVVLVHVENEQDQALLIHRSKGENLDSANDELRKLAKNPALVKSLAERNRDSIMSLFKEFRDKCYGVYSIQWFNSQGINQGGYPPENSLKDYDFNTKRLPDDMKFLQALKDRKEMQFDSPLAEGRNGQFFLVPVFDSDKFVGIIYTIRIRM